MTEIEKDFNTSEREREMKFLSDQPSRTIEK